ncbi:MAG: hypothetical protein WBG50_26120, partial [Desulfomonilaceae bacterium]
RKAHKTNFVVKTFSEKQRNLNGKRHLYHTFVELGLGLADGARRTELGKNLGKDDGMCSVYAYIQLSWDWVPE